MYTLHKTEFVISSERINYSVNFVIRCISEKYHLTFAQLFDKVILKITL